MRFAVCEVSSAPFLSRTLTWLEVPACVICTRYCSGLTLASLLLNIKDLIIEADLKRGKSG
ncbi:hypothetical protein D3C83_332340 [compost metagenome]